MSAIQPAPMSESAKARVRGQLQRALQERKGASWKRGLGLLLAVTLGLASLVALGGVAGGAFSPELLLTRVMSLVMLLGAGALAVVAAVRPGTSWTQRWASLGAVLAAVVSVLVLRADGHESSSPQWLCTVSHFGTELLPAAVAIFVMRSFDPGRLRATLAGAAVGLTGLFLGELACERGLVHVLLFHVPVLLVMVVLLPWLAERLGRRSFAP
ncbi:MAG: NrsF family protein [Myxococcota bacterium]